MDTDLERLCIFGQDKSTYRLQRVLNDQDHDVHSNDGNLSLHLEPGSLPGGEAYFVAMPGSSPAELVLEGDPYDETASGALIELERPAVLIAGLSCRSCLVASQ